MTERDITLPHAEIGILRALMKLQREPDPLL